VFDGTSNTLISSFVTGQCPVGVAVNSVTGRVYTADQNGNTASVISDGAPEGADLSVSMTASPDPTPPGGTLTYAITVANAGPATATTVTLKDTLPGQLS